MANGGKLGSAASMAVRPLTRRLAVAGLQCPKRLWLTVHKPPKAETTPAPPPMETRAELRRAMRSLHPRGRVVGPEGASFAAAVARTKALLGDSGCSAIFDAAFDAGGLRVRIDLLRRRARGWEIHAVLASKGVSARRVVELALQLHAARESGVEVRRVGALVANGDYTRGLRGVEWRKYFRFEDRTAEVVSCLVDMLPRLAGLSAVLARRAAPAAEPGSRCFQPNECPYWGRCTRKKPADWIYYLPNVRQRQWEELQRTGIESIAKLPDSITLSRAQKIIRDVLRSVDPYVSPDLRRALKGFGPPAFHLDFETMSPAVPLYPGTRPFERVPFQWSCHHLRADGSMAHAEFLAEGDTDPRPGFVEALLETLDGSNEPIVVYSPFESAVLKELGEFLPTRRKALDRLRGRLRDLLPVVRDNVYYSGFDFSFSIKTVGPALTGLTYDDLQGVADGDAASQAFVRIASGRFRDGETAASLRAALLAYCKRDTTMTTGAHVVLDRLIRQGSAGNA
jgi:hypothetical protein